MKAKWDGVLTATLVICALITTGLVVYREFFAPATRPESQVAQEPKFIKNWQALLGKGVRLGSPSAPVQLIEFGDFECPFCADFHKTLQLVKAKYPTQITVSFVHYPLPGHRFAEPAARAAECAGEQGRFEAMHDVLYEQQNQLGLKPWSELARQAAVPDVAEFESCTQRGQPVERIVEGKQLAEKMNIPGTPTLLVNGWQLPGPPRPEELDRMVKAALQGKKPVS